LIVFSVFFFCYIFLAEMRIEMIFDGLYDVQ
jgi:hypothetical protein